MKLFLLVENGGDGSYIIRFILDKNLINKLSQAYDDGKLDYDAPGVDGDGFSYETITVPDDSTSESLGIHITTEADFELLFPKGI